MSVFAARTPWRSGLPISPANTTLPCIGKCRERSICATARMPMRHAARGSAANDAAGPLFARRPSGGHGADDRADHDDAAPLGATTVEFGTAAARGERSMKRQRLDLRSCRWRRQGDRIAGGKGGGQRIVEQGVQVRLRGASVALASVGGALPLRRDRTFTIWSSRHCESSRLGSAPEDVGTTAQRNKPKRDSNPQAACGLKMPLSSAIQGLRLPGSAALIERFAPCK